MRLDHLLSKDLFFEGLTPSACGCLLGGSFDSAPFVLVWPFPGVGVVVGTLLGV